MTTGKAEVQSRSIITRRVASEDDDGIPLWETVELDNRGSE